MATFPPCCIMTLIAPGGRILASAVDAGDALGSAGTLKKAQEQRALDALSMAAAVNQCTAPYARGITAATARAIVAQLVESERCILGTAWPGHDEA
jgi:hypothetical protein